MNMTKKIDSIQQQIGSRSALQNYKLISTGHESGFWFFIMNEMLTMASSSVRGSLGVWFRRFTYALLTAHVGKKVKIGRECSMKRPQHITLEDGTKLGDYVSLDIKNHGKNIIIGKNVTIGHSTIFSCIGGKIIIGYNSEIGKSCRLGSLKNLTIGKNVKIGDCCYVIGAGHEFDSLEIPIIKQNVVSKGPSIIEDNVVIGEQVSVLDGVKIGEGARVKAGSLVNKDVPAGKIVGGIPAEIVG